MRHAISTLTLAAALGFVLLAGDASACHKKAKCATPCAPAPVVCVAPAPVCKPVKTCHFKMPKIKMPKMGCHKKAVCATPVYYSAAPVNYPTPQGSPQVATPQS